MKIIQFNSVGGASGDMLLGALIALGADAAELEKELSSLMPDEKFSIDTKEVDRCGIHGVETSVVIEEKHHHHHHLHGGDHHHHHRNFAMIREMIEKSSLSDNVKAISIKAFRRLAEAEGKIHNMEVDKVHFHEVGAADSIIDTVGCCLALEMLGVDAVSVAPLPLGQGTLKCQHGIYPVPAPATLEILKGFPVVQTEEPFELVTPTGATLLTSWEKASVPPGSSISAVAYSFGHRTLNNRPNVIRASLYESAGNTESDSCTILETNIDDLSPEISATLFDKLLNNGALDVYTTAVQMKKQRNGLLLTVICREEDSKKLGDLIFLETSTFGIRERSVGRRILERSFFEVETSFGKVKIKKGLLEGETVTCSPEIDDCIALAEENGIPLKKVYNEAVLACGLIK